MIDTNVILSQEYEPDNPFNLERQNVKFLNQDVEMYFSDNLDGMLSMDELYEYGLLGEDIA